MPSDYVSADLKGAEAIAYRLHEDTNEERCRSDARDVTCVRGREHAFEIYYQSGAIPKRLDVPYFHEPLLPSAMLLTTREKEWEFQSRVAKARPRQGAMNPFYQQQFDLQSIANGKIAWPLGSMEPRIFYANVFEGMDYVVLRGAQGFTRRPDWARLGTHSLVLTVRKPGDTDKRKSYEIPLSDFALVIDLPSRISDKVVANDVSRTGVAAPPKPATKTK